ncbi:MAG: YihY family inner membrane protein [Betaproteobacteria bacterium]|nr:YihY family inner membrane protein [Betaproteobacteria bacterium]
MKFLDQLWAYIRFVANRFVKDRCLMVAGSLTYTSLLAIVPTFTVTLVLTSHVAVIRNLILQVKTFALENLLPDVGARAVTVYMEQFSQNAAKLTIIGLVIIVATAVALMFTIDTEFNYIWRARRRRTWWKRLAAYLAVLAVGPLLIGASLTLTSYFVHWSRKLGGVLPSLDDWLLQLIPFLLSTLALAIAYCVMPARHVPIRHAVAGGVIAGLLFEIVKHLFVVYIMRVATYSVVYGAFASVPIFLLWLFCCWIVVLIGAELTATFSYFGHVNAKAIQPDPSVQSCVDAGRLLDALAESEAGQGLAALRARAPMPIDVAEDLLRAMCDASLVEVDKRGRYRLVHPRESIRDDDARRAILNLCQARDNVAAAQEAWN